MGETIVACVVVPTHESVAVTFGSGEPIDPFPLIRVIVAADAFDVHMIANTHTAARPKHFGRLVGQRKTIRITPDPKTPRTPPRGRLK